MTAREKLRKSLKDLVVRTRSEFRETRRLAKLPGGEVDREELHGACGRYLDARRVCDWYGIDYRE